MPESPQTPSMMDRAKRWMRLLKRHSRSSSTGPDEKRAAEIFSNARDFTINGAQFINAQKVNYINDVVSNGQAVFELLEPYACLDATKDSSARYPPPKCHPETRLKIRERLTQWLSNEHEEQKMFWVRGSAGTGKSAVAQSFGDTCEEDNSLGGSYFFSRVANRAKLETVVPTLVYQLADSVPEYRSSIAHRLAESPLILRKSPPVLFRKLIIEPFAALHRQRPRKPIAVILDGLDECEGEDAQLVIIEMITNAVRSNPELPLRWIIFSRPEVHLKNVFSRNLLCGREELILDAECWENVELYVKDRFTEIKITYKDVIPAEWPSQNQLEELLNAVSGLFVLASTCLNFIANPEGDDPPSRLDSLLMFLKRSQDVVSGNPLAALDLLYSQILEKIPPLVLKTTRKILGFMCIRNKLEQKHKLDSAQALANFLRLDHRAFYMAVRGLHSVMSIPEPEDATKSQLQFYHASFHDFLLDPNRSGKFAIDEQEALSDILQFSCYWYDLDATHFHRHDEEDFDFDHKHDSLPHLTWVSEDNRSLISQSVMKFIEDSVFNTSPNIQLDIANDQLLSQLSGMDFRHWYSWSVFRLAHVCRLGPPIPLIRTEPSSPTDHQLLRYFTLVVGNGYAQPANFPLSYSYPHKRWTREYFFIGHGVKSAIYWLTKPALTPSWLHRSLRSDQEPTEAQIARYVSDIESLRWNEEKARLQAE